jgi:hypothetical protein
VHHNDKVYGVLLDAASNQFVLRGTDIASKADGYPPNSHGVSCELVNDRLKENVRKHSTNCRKIDKQCRLIIKSVKDLPKDFVRDRIACLP